jgi:hypothetical protein
LSVDILRNKIWTIEIRFPIAAKLLSSSPHTLPLRPFQHKTDHSPPSVSKHKNAWSFTSTTLYSLLLRITLLKTGASLLLELTIFNIIGNCYFLTRAYEKVSGLFH